jgi:hypothetical protein
LSLCLNRISLFLTGALGDLYTLLTSFTSIGEP